MPSIFALLAQVCGLSHREAADFLDARPDTIQSWSTGRRTAPDGAIEELAALADRIDEEADVFIAALETQAADFGEPDVVELGLAADDNEAQSLGWPCVGAHRAVLGLAVARGMAEGYRFRIVPRGSTLPTAAASDAHGR